jgi:phosphonate transport system substrate-binding protein
VAAIALALSCVLIATGLASSTSVNGGEQKAYSFAVVPQFPPAQVERDWRPLLERVSAKAGLRLELKFYRSIPEFEQDFLKGGPDFAYLSPFHAVMAKKSQGYVPLVRDAGELVGILVVRRDSGITSVRQLNGKELVFPSPGAFASSLYMRALLAEKERIAFTPKYVTTHSNVYRHVALGTAAAGGGANKTLNKEPRELRDQLSVIYRTPAVAPHPVCAHPRVPQKVRDAVADAFPALAGEGALQDLFRAVEMARPVRADYAGDYEPLERLGLNLSSDRPMRKGQ